MTPERVIIENMFRIPDKAGRDVDFYLNDVQASLDSNRTQRNIIPKARQRGISTYIVALFLAVCLSMRNRRCVIVSHSVDATTKLLDKVHYILRNLRGGVSADLRYSSRNELVFTKTESVFYVGTAGNSNVGIGDTITHLHCSEPALWNDPLPLLKGLFNAVPTDTGTIFIEGTGNGMGNWYHRQCMRAAEGTGFYKLHFFSWTDAAEYRMSVGYPAPFIESLNEEEKSLYDHKVLDVEQLAWRRAKIEEMDFDLKKFREQYPLSLEECFQGSGASFFHQIAYEISAAWRPSEKHKHLSQLTSHPHPLQHYVAGVDVGAGAGLDNTVLQIFSLEEMRQVAEWSSGEVEPHRAAEMHIPILKEFNVPYINPERNNHGAVYIKSLIEKYPHGAVHMSRPPTRASEVEFDRLADYGTFTSHVSRPKILGEFRKLVAKELKIHSPLLKGEMDSFIETESHRLEPQQGCMDDRVLAAAQATYVLYKALARANIWSQEQKIAASPFQLEGILKGLEEAYQIRMVEEA